VDCGTQNGGRSVIGAAFELLDHVGALEPVRLIDLAEATGIPRQTVHRLLKQLIEVGAVRREGTRSVSERACWDWVLASRLSVACASSPADRWPNSRRPPASP
jgi:hypothetical protein